MLSSNNMCCRRYRIHLIMLVGLLWRRHGHHRTLDTAWSCSRGHPGTHISLIHILINHVNKIAIAGNRCLAI